MNKFTRVTLDRELHADADGYPVFRQCFEHEILMSFDDDSGAYAFTEWWEDVGANQLYDWMSKHSEYKEECKWQDEM